ncbi:MAG: putative transport system ATP-binding protein [Bacillota bacterium]|jgi:putative ABC transport system ATP-binding protein|nr:putative transport system ATP-binding protein [Bacillota bacterium]MDK2784732.1 putative transport system ATP-binding protein [Bacillota bacterium]MDK2882789.1 putative transport system ATP-binding protein [Bacillota bacterium]
MSAAFMLEVEEVTKIYRLGRIKVPALRGVTLGIRPGEMVAVMGPSGSGKSTLMNILGCLDRPSGGVYRLDGEEVGKKSDRELASIRNRKIGFIFQNFNLLPQLTALENVELPLIYRGVPARERRRRAEEALVRLGLKERLRHSPRELSGGQQQRVAIARALAAQPEVILADEPTGNLDSRAGEEILAVFQELNAEGITVVMVTHDPNVARHSERIVRLADGRIVSDERVLPEERLSAQELLAKLPGAEEGGEEK